MHAYQLVRNCQQSTNLHHSWLLSLDTIGKTKHFSVISVFIPLKDSVTHWLYFFFGNTCIYKQAFKQIAVSPWAARTKMSVFWCVCLFVSTDLFLRTKLPVKSRAGTPQLCPAADRHHVLGRQPRFCSDEGCARLWWSQHPIWELLCFLPFQ